MKLFSQFIVTLSYLAASSSLVLSAELCVGYQSLVEVSKPINITRFKSDWEQRTNGSSISLNCNSSKEQGHCIWEFSYRNKRVSPTFERLNEEVQKCFGDDAVQVKDQSVNHPDFYDLRTYNLPYATLSVSIKDKISLEKTFVFFRIAKSSD